MPPCRSRGLGGVFISVTENSHAQRFSHQSPVLGRISIGKVVEKNGKRLPEKDDQFTLTSQLHNRDGWLLHPLNEELRNGKDGKLRSIPIRLAFNEPDLNFRADYSLFRP